eukprot:352834-Chlamydomonas_euryale.AAC.12
MCGCIRSTLQPSTWHMRVFPAFCPTGAASRACFAGRASGPSGSFSDAVSSPSSGMGDAAATQSAAYTGNERFPEQTGTCRSVSRQQACSMPTCA